jgi:hypothetical protein
MTDSLRDCIAAVIRKHPQGQEWGIPEEECTNCPRFNGDWAAHVADAVIRELRTFHQEASEDEFLDELLKDDDETH